MWSSLYGFHHRPAIMSWMKWGCSLYLLHELWVMPWLMDSLTPWFFSKWHKKKCVPTHLPIDPLNTRISDVPKLGPDLHIFPSVVTKQFVTRGFLNLGIATSHLAVILTPGKPGCQGCVYTLLWYCNHRDNRALKKKSSLHVVDFQIWPMHRSGPKIAKGASD